MYKRQKEYYCLAPRGASGLKYADIDKVAWSHNSLAPRGASGLKCLEIADMLEIVSLAPRGASGLK